MCDFRIHGMVVREVREKRDKVKKKTKTKRKIGNNNIILGCSLQPNSIPHTRTLIREIRAGTKKTHETKSR